MSLTIDWNAPPPKKTQTYNSLEEMLVELGLKPRLERPDTLGKAELHTSFWTSDDPKNISWYNLRKTGIVEVRHIYGDERDIPYEPGPNSDTLIVFHPHPWNEPCWAKYKCRLVNEEIPSSSNLPNGLCPP